MSRLLMIGLLLTATLTAPVSRARADPPKRVKVVMHQVQCVRWRCGAGLQEALTDRVASGLTRSRRYKLVDRANLKKAMGEQLKCRRGVRSGLISRECLIEAGRVAQAEKMVSGRLVKVGGRNYQLTLGVTDLGSVESDRSVSLLCSKCSHMALLALVDKTVARLVGLGSRQGSTARAPALAAPPVPRVKPDTEQPLPAIGSELGTLRVEGSPRGARVDVTGPQGFKGPRATALPHSWRGVPAGNYRVTVRAADRVPFDATVKVLPDRTSVVTAELVLSHGRLTIGGKPAGARVEVACASGYKKVFGLTSGFTLRQVPRGSCTVTVSRMGYTRYSRPTEVVGGKTTRVTVALPQEDAAAHVGEPGGLTKSQIQAGMRSTRLKVRGCYDRFKVAGLARIQLTINPNGRVNQVRVKGVFAGTSTGQCLKRVVKSARFPRFNGAPIVIRYPYILR